MRHHRVHIGARLLSDRQRIGEHARADGRVHRVRRAERAEQIRPARAKVRARVCPQPVDARTSASAAGEEPMREGARRRSIGHSSRKTPKPPCISAAIERAKARGANSAGQKRSSPERSASHSMIAVVSHTHASPSHSAGTRPEGSRPTATASAKARVSSATPLDVRLQPRQLECEPTAQGPTRIATIGDQQLHRRRLGTGGLAGPALRPPAPLRPRRHRLLATERPTPPDFGDRRSARSASAAGPRCGGVAAVDRCRHPARRGFPRRSASHIRAAHPPARAVRPHARSADASRARSRR